jgi:hypothetical protein
MPSQFDRQFTVSGFPALLAQFGESVTYHFASGGSRVVDAIIERTPPAIYDTAGNVVQPSFTVRINSNATTGVKLSEVNTGGDQISLLANINDTVATKKSVLMPMSQDSLVTHLALK